MQYEESAMSKKAKHIDTYNSKNWQDVAGYTCVAWWGNEQTEILKNKTEVVRLVRGKQIQ